MDKKQRMWLFIIALLLLVDISLAGRNEITIRIWLFQGTMIEGEPGLSQVELMPLSSTPELSSLRALAEGSEHDFRDAVIDTLLDLKKLRTLNDLFLFKQTQREDLPFPGKVVLGRQIAYRIDLSHKVLSPMKVALRVVLSKTKEGIIRPEKEDRIMLRNTFEATRDKQKMHLIVDQTLTVGLNDPVVVSVPNENRPYFMAIKLTANEPELKRRTSPTLKSPPMPKLVPAPQPVDKVLPSYPEELRRRGITGEVGLRIAIDENGTVRYVHVASSLHPYLDYAACQAFWQWRFEPVLQKGKPVPAAFDYAFNFDPRVYAEELTYIEENAAVVSATTREQTERILNGCAEYCRKLADAALFYTSEETIKETTHSLAHPDRLAELVGRFPSDYAVQVTESADGQMTGWIVDRPQIMSIGNVERIRYNCDYQMIRRFGEIKERRIVLKENGRKVLDEVRLLEEDRYSTLSPVVSLLKILDKDHQPLFNYRICGEKKVSGKDAYVLEAVPKFGDADGVCSAKVWVEKGGFQILKSEIEGVPLYGYDDVLREAVFLNIKPFYLRTYEYKVEKNGVMLPDRTTVQIKYPSLMPNRRETKSRIELTYKDFKFFIVETETAIKK
ncbi:MAG: TonB family protein [Candidatus Aminicenantes bacterium]|nr:TonB family protein [Candidatus Aminicenantes bacterium]MDH5706138.1 TonB family protein [Candidatus Aminicenantes bacterium]